jgi:uncharacterized protein YcfL
VNNAENGLILRRTTFGHELNAESHVAATVEDERSRASRLATNAENESTMSYRHIAARGIRQRPAPAVRNRIALPPIEVLMQFATTTKRFQIRLGSQL